ncbi:hypothetical protein RJ639_031722 [Escallonia herrerae]|uniref:Protein TIC 20 n=1 Tax=Escallonia herrerae TaxID=1293975 RepID=A0AA88WXK3_9ASTE|nr:hypothetical protein RJ639_031722 [Escallonia herrerae]
MTSLKSTRTNFLISSVNGDVIQGHCPFSFLSEMFFLTFPFPAWTSQQRLVGHQCPDLLCFTGNNKILPLTSGNPLLNLSAASSPLLSGDLGGLSRTIPKLPRRRQITLSPRAAKDVPSSYRFPAMTKKPRWWWRTLACLPYLMPLHETWMYAETAYHLHPFLEDFEFLTYPFLGAIGRLPSWFLMAYFFVAYLGVVRRKEWPHFFRFHVVMGMLLEIALQVIGTMSRWMPLAVYWGKVGMHFWTTIAFAYLFTVLESMRCALAGMYADIPFVPKLSLPTSLLTHAFSSLSHIPTANAALQVVTADLVLHIHVPELSQPLRSSRIAISTDVEGTHLTHLYDALPPAPLVVSSDDLSLATASNPFYSITGSNADTQGGDDGTESKDMVEVPLEEGNFGWDLDLNGNLLKNEQIGELLAKIEVPVDDNLAQLMESFFDGIIEDAFDELMAGDAMEDS